MLIEVLVSLVAILGSLYLFIKRNDDYWKKKGVVYVEPKFPLGTMNEQLFDKVDAGTVFQRIYTKYKEQGLKYVGNFMISHPVLTLIDLDLCKNILAKDFNHFVNRDVVLETHEYIYKHLFSLGGQEWKDMRTKLTPTFTSGKMKAMFTLMEKCAQQLQDHIDNEVLKTREFQVKDLIARFTTDIIATCAFGLEVNSIEDRDNEFFKIGQLIFVPNRSVFLKVLMWRCFPKMARLLRINFFDPRISKFLTKTVKHAVEYRKQNNIVRNDFIHLLLKVKENKSLDDEDNKATADSNKNDTHNKVKDHLTLEEMVAQTFLFFAAGFETAASTTSFCLYELAKNPEVQERLRREIDEVLENHGGKITYQALQEMGYMEQVVNETLRRYASLPFLNRTCTEPYQVPGTDLVLEKEVLVIIPTFAIHHDPDIYPDPYKFDPDRFSEENSKNRHHYAFLPFGEGPRVCLGMRFGRLQVKIGLAVILSRYELSLASDTPSKLEIDPFIFITTPKCPFRLKITKRSIM